MAKLNDGIEKRRLGKAGQEVSRLCLGTMMFGDRTDEAGSIDIIAAYAAAGGNFIDTADVYAGGRSEEIVGAAFDGSNGLSRDDFVVATKFGNKMRDDPTSGGLSPAYMARALDASLDRLQMESVDLYYLHLDDEATPLDTVIDAMGRAIEDGKVRHWGFSNFRGWKIAEMVAICDRLGVARPVALQPYYHALYRDAERELLPACEHFGIGVVSYSPLARGVLTGKYSSSVPEGSRGSRGDVRISETEMRPALLDAARAFDEHVTANGRRSADVAVQWVLANRAITSVLAGPRTLGQLEGYLAALEGQLTDADEAFVAKLVPAGTSAGSTYFDPRYPYRGRFLARSDA
ncbi:aldo/keto reductase [Rhizobiaceae bacterium]|nr:aldo/keto reductase [Rhizobiaceae bacterium]